MTVAQAIAAVCASEHLREDFVAQLFRQNGNGLVSVLTHLSYMSQEQKDKYRYPYQRLCIKTGIDEEVCKQALLECNNDEKVALQYLLITNNEEVKKEITYEMQAEVRDRTGMDLNETRQYLVKTNGNVEKAIELIDALPSFKRQITYEMQAEVRDRTGMDLNETRKYLERTNADVEKAIELIKALPSFKRQITYEMQAEVRDRTGMDLNETRKYLERTNADVEKAIELIKVLPSFKRQITYEMQAEIRDRTGMDLNETRKYLERTNADVEKAIELIKTLPSFKRQITYEMQAEVRDRTGIDLNETRKYLERTNADVEKAIELIVGKKSGGSSKDYLNNNFIVNGTVLSKYTGKEEEVTIPSEIKTIGHEAFYNNSYVKRVIIPPNVIIEDEAFRDCENLSSLSKNGGVVIVSGIGKSVFWGCEKLDANIRFTGNSIGSNAFYGCSSIKRVIINDGVNLGEDAFQDCSMLTHICEEGQTWRSGEIAAGAFYGCENLISKIEVNEKIVRKNAFYDCCSLTMILLPNFVDLEEDAFQDCSSLEHITEKGKRITIAELGTGTFYGCESLCSNIKLINSLIPKNAFYDCSSLVKIDIPDGADFDEYAFQDCASLKSICEDRPYFTIGKVGIGAFENCESLITPIKITDSVIPKDAFYYCESLKIVYLPSNVTIEKDAFEGCEAKHLSYKELPPVGVGKGGQTITDTMGENQDNIIGFQDFIVKTDVYNCRKKGHELKEVTAIIFCMNTKGEIIEKQVMAGYCKNCQRYYILNREFERLKTNYRVLCRVIDNSVVTSGGTGVFADLNQESIIKQYGYTVNQQDSLSTLQRQTILEFLVAAKILTKAEICSHLDWLISSRSYDKHKFRVAIGKWSEDRDFIAGYQLSENRKVIVRKITKGKVRY